MWGVTGILPHAWSPCNARERPRYVTRLLPRPRPYDARRLAIARRGLVRRRMVDRRHQAERFEPLRRSPRPRLLHVRRSHGRNQDHLEGPANVHKVVSYVPPSMRRDVEARLAQEP